MRELSIRPNVVIAASGEPHYKLFSATQVALVTSLVPMLAGVIPLAYNCSKTGKKACVNSLKTCGQTTLAVMFVFAMSYLVTESAKARHHIFGRETPQTINDNSPQRQQNATALIPGKPIEREIAGGQTHSYQLHLAEGQYLRLVVDQKGIEMVATLFSPDRKKLAGFSGCLMSTRCFWSTRLAKSAATCGQ